jgi:hypothetical protein
MAEKPTSTPSPPEIKPLPDTVLVPETRSGGGSVETKKR